MKEEKIIPGESMLKLGSPIPRTIRIRYGMVTAARKIRAGIGFFVARRTTLSTPVRKKKRNNAPGVLKSSAIHDPRMTILA